MIYSLIIIFLILISFVSYKKIINPNSIIIVWWGGWYLISTLSLTGIDKPSNYTGVLILLFLSGFTFGNLFYMPHMKIRLYNVYNNPQNNRIYLFYLKMIKYTYFPIFLIFAYYTAKAIYIIGTQGVLLYRLSSFSSERGGGVSILYENSYINLFVDYFLLTYMIILALIGSAISIYYKKYVLLIPPVILIIMHTLMQLGRGSIYLLLFFVVMSYLLINRGNMKINATAIKAVSLVVIVVAFLFMLEPIRGGDLSMESIYRLASQPVIDYHTLGFVLFDKEVTNDNSVINQNLTFGLRSIGGVTALFEQIYHKIIDSSYTTLAFYEGTTREYDTIVGYDEYGPKTGNAFYTGLYSLYMDGRELFIFIIPFILGIFVKFNYVKWQRYNNLKNIIYVIGVMFILVFSIFQSQFESTTNWIGLLYIIMFFYAAKHCCPVVKRKISESCLPQ